MSEINKNEVEIDDGAPVQWKKYQTYACKVNPDQDDKATEIQMCSLARPHMRAFHVAWWSFFMAFLVWFAIAPLQHEIQTSLGLAKKDLWTASIASVTGTVFLRFLLGPLCDKFGGRALMGIVLMAASIPTACTGLIQSATGLALLRFFIGIAGGTFVMCQFWMSRMFAKNVVGSANGIVAGWGNLGGGVTQLFMGTMLFPLFKNVFFDGDAEKAWRTVCIVPAVIAFFTGIMCYFVADDAPKGNYSEMKKHGTIVEASAVESFRQGAVNINTWIMFIQYGACFGVELAMYNATVLYFIDVFGLSTERSAGLSSLFGWMCLFARGTGGIVSDYINSKMGLKGRILYQTTLLIGEGAMILVFAHTKTLTGSVIVMVVFSLFVQMCEGSTFGIVPYIDSRATGSISGIVGAGGNVGAVVFQVCFRQLPYKEAFTIMGFYVLGCSLTSIFLVIEGHAGLFFGSDTETEPKQTLEVPDQENKDDDSEGDVDEKEKA